MGTSSTTSGLSIATWECFGRSNSYLSGRGLSIATSTKGAKEHLDCHCQIPESFPVEAKSRCCFRCDFAALLGITTS